MLLEGVHMFCRTMKDLWDEDMTDGCRLRFINSMYKFPSTPSVQLSSGHHMPILGVSTWLKQNVQETVEHALRSGFRCVTPMLCSRISQNNLDHAHYQEDALYNGRLTVG